MDNVAADSIEVRAGILDGKAVLNIKAHETCGTLRLEDDGDILLSVDLPPCDCSTALQVSNAKLWDCEHPNLYNIILELADGQIISRRAGFAQITRDGGRVLWNGAALKLRGVNYREAASAEQMRSDLRIFCDANINYLRSLFHPFSEDCLSVCDELGLLVEQCAPFRDIADGRQDSPALLERDVLAWRNVILEGRSHPCLLMWTAANESTWGVNFRAMTRESRRLDPERLHNFHFPMTVPIEDGEPDVWSVAYADWRQPMDERLDHMIVGHTHGADNVVGYAAGSAPECTKPVLHVAFAHLPCHNRDQIERDGGIHEFWGESIVRFADKMWHTRDCLGGAVMAGVDEDGVIDPKYEGYHWGLLDLHHKPKPELFHLKMAYSPLRIFDISAVPDGIAVTLENRFLHTNLSELSITWRGGEQSGTLSCVAAPGEITRIILPSSAIELVFASPLRKWTIPTAAALRKKDGEAQTTVSYGDYKLDSDDNTATLSNSSFRFVFSKETGLLTGAYRDGALLIESGPRLQATRLTLGAWSGALSGVSVDGDTARAIITGEYEGVCRVRFTLDISGGGEIGTRCDILTLSRHMPHTVKAIIGLDPGGLDELGVAYLLPYGAERLDWKRDALPDGHIGRPEGCAVLSDKRDFTSMKHNIRRAVVSGVSGGAEAVSDGTHSIRLEIVPDERYIVDDRDARIRYDGEWREMDDYCGDYQGTESLSNTKGDAFELTFTGTGVRLYGPTDMLHGIGRALIDGQERGRFSQYPLPVDFPGMSRGHEKRYGVPLFEARDLPLGEHTLRVEVTGERDAGAQDCYVSVDKVIVESPDARPKVLMILNSGYNYTRLVRGNYMREKLTFATGDSITGARIRLVSAGESEDSI